MRVEDQLCFFFDDDEFVETGRAGFRRRVITGDRMQLCFWRIKGGASGSILHKHDEHEQFGFIVRGALDFRISPDSDGTDREMLEANDVYLARPAVWHGDSVFIGDDEFDECWILDVFCPPRPELSDP